MSLGSFILNDELGQCVSHAVCTGAVLLNYHLTAEIFYFGPPCRQLHDKGGKSGKVLLFSVIINRQIFIHFESN